MTCKGSLSRRLGETDRRVRRALRHFPGVGTGQPPGQGPPVVGLELPISNPDFELGEGAGGVPRYWGNGSGTGTNWLGIETSSPLNGTYSGLFSADNTGSRSFTPVTTPNGTRTQAANQIGVNHVIRVEDGDQFILTTRAQATAAITGSGLTALFRLFDEGGTALGTQNFKIASSNLDWTSTTATTKRGVITVSTANAYLALLEFQVAQSVSGTDTFRVDDIDLVKRPKRDFPTVLSGLQLSTVEKQTGADGTSQLFIRAEWTTNADAGEVVSEEVQYKAAQIVIA